MKLPPGQKKPVALEGEDWEIMEVYVGLLRPMKDVTGYGRLQGWLGQDFASYGPFAGRLGEGKGTAPGSEACASSRDRCSMGRPRQLLQSHG